MQAKNPTLAAATVLAGLGLLAIAAGLIMLVIKGMGLAGGFGVGIALASLLAAFIMLATR